MTLDEILAFVGPLDDTLGENTARERFRGHLAKSANTSGVLRDYIATCLRVQSQQHERAFQDLVNHCGRLLGFQVEFGRYAAGRNLIGPDGVWHSPSTGFSIVAAIEATNAYVVKSSTLVRYVDELISEKRISDWDHALGLYVVGRIDAKLAEINSRIVAARRVRQLHIASIDALLILAEIMERAEIGQHDVLAVLRPGGPLVVASQRDDTVPAASAAPRSSPRNRRRV